MSSFRKLLLVSNSLLAVLARGQTVPAPGTSAPPGPIQHLDKFIVSAGPDPKSAFDLAQGTTVLAGEELHHQLQATLGQTLAVVSIFDNLTNALRSRLIGTPR